MRFRAWTLKVLASAGAAALASSLAPAFADKPVSGGIDLQAPATQVAQNVHDFHNLLLVIITAITLFVLALLLWVIVRYNSKANPTPKKFSHNTLLEILWTAVPVLILVFIAYKSFPLLYEQDQFPTHVTMPDGTKRPITPDDILDVKVVGHQWYWTYAYGTTDDAPSFNSNMLAHDALQPNQINRLSVDNPLVVPAGKFVRISLTASTVIHAWAIPAFTIKTDAVPGRINQMWFKVDKPGIFYGQCSELCGAAHSGMPIEVRVLSQSDYDQWYALLQSDKPAARQFLFRVQPEPPTAQVAAAH